MLHIFQVIILGLVEGITEFLPISSTGHLILAGRLLDVPSTEFVKSFEIIIQLGAILAVLALYWKKLFLDLKIFLRVAVAFIPTAILGVLFYGLVKKYLLGNVYVVLWSLLIGGIIMIAFEYGRKGKSVSVESLESITYKQALIIGAFQSIAFFPGVSRSAATIVGGLSLGISRDTIVELSFLLAVPTMIAATGMDLLKSGHSFSGGEVGMLLLGLVVAFASAILSIKFLLKYLKNHSFIPFGFYRIIIALAGFMIFL